MLTERQKKFVDAYAGRGTGIVAARAAGYAGTDAVLRVAASKLLRVPEVAAAIEDRGVATAARRHAPAKADPRIAGPIEQQRILTAIARDRAEDSETRIKAVVALAKIQTPQARPAAAPAGPAPSTTVRALFHVTHDPPIDATPAEAANG